MLELLTFTNSRPMCSKPITMAGKSKPPGGWEDLEPELKRIAKLIHAGKMAVGDIDPKMISKIAEQMMLGVFDGYGKAFDDTLTKAEFTMLQALEENVYVFAGFKNYQQVKESSMLLKTEDGAIKPFNQFYKEMQTINGTYNEIYAGAEYNTALTSSQMISQWQAIQENISHSPNLTYRTSGGDKVCEICAPLDGITQPADSDFWDSYYIPNHFFCDCDVIQSDDDVTGVDMRDLPELQDMFNNNVGKNGIIFPDTMPYMQNVPKADKKEIIKEVGKITPDRKFGGDEE